MDPEISPNYDHENHSSLFYSYSRVDPAGRYLSRLRNPKPSGALSQSMSRENFNPTAKKVFIHNSWRQFYYFRNYSHNYSHIKNCSSTHLQWRADLLDATVIARTRLVLTLPSLYAIKNRLLIECFSAISQITL